MWVQILSHLIQNTDGNGLKAMPGSIPHPILVHSWKNKKNIGSQMGKTNEKNNILESNWTYYNINAHLMMLKVEPFH